MKDFSSFTIILMFFKYINMLDAANKKNQTVSFKR